MAEREEYFNQKYIYNNSGKDKDKLHPFRTYSDVRVETRPAYSLQTAKPRQESQWDKLQRGELVDPIALEDELNIQLLRSVAEGTHVPAEVLIQSYEDAKLGKKRRDLTEVAPEESVPIKVVPESASNKWVPSTSEKAMKPMLGIMLGGAVVELLFQLNGIPLEARGYALGTGTVIGTAVYLKGIATEIYERVADRSQAKKLVKAPQSGRH